MAFVLIQHLDPTHPSLLTEALTRTTKMPVLEIREGMKVTPNSVFVIPPNFDVALLKGRFQLSPRGNNPRPHMSIDYFFRSLAADCGNRAIGVVLSGTATDGTEGLRAIKAENGVTLAQDPKSAKFNGMPQSAVNAEVVDFCLPVLKLAKELVRLAHHPFITSELSEPLFEASDDQNLEKLFVLLRASTGVDYSEYKIPTIKRRLARRLALLKTDSLKDYIKYLQTNPDEIKALASDVLIHVTSFFRDPDVFKEVQNTILPEIIKHKAIGAPIRVWVTGCASGEEVYSLAILLLELLGENATRYSIQVFGSDVSEHMIQKARNGFYNYEAMHEMLPERIKKFFIKVDGGYRINKLVRDLCVFVRHDLARDPPFSKLDLVTCRNVLIYFEPLLQRRIISTFHYCLNQPGFLLLGRTERISAQQHLFATLDKKNKIFSREAVTSHLKFVTLQNTSTDKPSPSASVTEPARPIVDIGKQIDSLLLARYSPAGVLVNEQMDVIQYRGQTSTFLQPPPGQPQLNLFKMVREGLFTSLKVALAQAKKSMTVIHKDGLEFKQNSTKKMCNLVVIPITKLPGSKEPLFLVLFEEVHLPKKASNKKVKAKSENAAQRSAKLEHELRSTQEYLQALNEEHQKTNDDLNSLNEEFVSGNEELQSMNEELETAKEELQSTNEELTTVNDELQNRNLETVQINDDLMNLLNSAEIPIVILDLHRRIRRFTPKARKIMNLLPSDIGRQIDDIKLNIKIENLEQQIQEVIETANTHESEVLDQQGAWQRVQIRPYKTIDNKIDGAVLSLTNIDGLKRALIDAEWIRDYSADVVEAIQTPLLVLNENLTILSANQSFYDSYGYSKLNTEGRNIFDLNPNSQNKESLKELLKSVFEQKTSFKNIEISSKIRQVPKTLSLSARPILSRNGTTTVLLAIEDITLRKNIEIEKKKLLEQAQNASQAKDMFLATLSHELRTPLTSLILQAQLLQRGSLTEEKIQKASISIQKAAHTQSQLIEDLLDVSRIVTGNLKLKLTPVYLSSIILNAIETVSAFAESKQIVIKPNLDTKVGEVLGDTTRLQQVIWNLLTNAIKFTPAEGRIEIGLKSENGFAKIQVVDTGAGIAADFLPNVFRRFTQAQDTITRSHGGLGLGLAIVHHMVEAHGGTVKAESAGIDKGSTFTLMIPLIKTTGTNVQAQISNAFSGTPVSRGKQFEKLQDLLKGVQILLVEDDEEARESIVDVLNQTGAVVRAAQSAADAIRVLECFSPDKMILDIAMPEEDGYSLLRKIRKLEEGKTPVPAIALSALASDKDRQNARDAGFQMHLTKPVDIDQLVNALIEVKT